MKSAFKSGPKPKVLQDDGDPDRSITPSQTPRPKTPVAPSPTITNGADKRDLDQEFYDSEADSESSMNLKEEESERRRQEQYEMEAYDRASELFHVTFNHIIRLYKIE